MLRTSTPRVQCIMSINSDSFVMTVAYSEATKVFCPTSNLLHCCKMLLSMTFFLLKQNPYQHHVLNCDNQRWYSKRLVWPIHVSWHFCQRFVSHYVMTFFSVISSARCHDKCRRKQNHVCVANSTVMIRGATQVARPSHAWWHFVQPTLGQLLGRNSFCQWLFR